jgi:hypothetical protein
MLWRAKEKCVNALFELYLQVYLVGLRFGVWVRQTLMYRTSPAIRKRLPQSGTILIVGDGIAEGVGDNLSSGGLASRVSALLREHRGRTGLKFLWEAVTVGKLHSTSIDWLPVAPPGDDGDGGGSVSLFRRALATGPFRRAEVVVVIVGSHERVADSAATVGNIAQIADAAARLGKHVLVASIPSFAEPRSDAGKAAHARNVALQAALSALPTGEYAPKGSVSHGVDAQQVLARGGDVVQTENSFLTFNAMGYRSYARELHDTVAPLAMRVEWAYWKQRL